MADDSAPQPVSRGSSITLFDWLKLLLLPVVLAAGLLLLILQQQHLSTQAMLMQRDTAFKIAHEQQQNSLLTSYMSTITDMIAHDRLREAQKMSPVRLAAQAQTMETLQALDGNGRGALLRFLYATTLINNDVHVIDLRDADLSNASLHGADLRDTYLLGANLRGADLSGVNLSYAVLSYVDFTGANLVGANLRACDMHDTVVKGAKLDGAQLQDVIGTTDTQLKSAQSLAGTIMPDGSTHP